MISGNEIKKKATARLKDYLIWRSIPLPKGKLFLADLNSLGFDAIDWGILIGEIQCDCLVMIDWSDPDLNFVSLNDVVSAIANGQTMQRSIQIHNAMARTMPTEKQLEHIEKAKEFEWPT